MIWHGFRILEEQVLRDGRFLYTVMETEWNPHGVSLTPGQWYIPPVMLEAPDPDFPRYFYWIQGGLHKIVTSRGEAALQWMRTADRELAAMEVHPVLKEYKEAHHENF